MDYLQFEDEDYDGYDYEFWENKERIQKVVQELELNVKSSIKKEFLEEMEILKKENEELQEIKAGFEEIKRCYENKKLELVNDYKKREKELETNKLNEIFKNIKSKLYVLRCENIRMEKCNKCDDRRKIKFIAPNNEEMHYRCDCDKLKRNYVVNEIELFYFKKDSGNVKFSFYTENDDCYKIKSDFGYCDNNSFETMHEEIIKQGSWYAHEKIIFKEKEKAEEFVRFLNEKEEYK
jgi:hypothetical protein